MSGSSERHKAWRNMLVAGLNEALRLGRITLDPENEPDETPFDFTFAGLPARGCVRILTHGEVHIIVLVNPKPTRWPLSCDADISDALAWYGDAYAGGWLERETGKWLQQSGGRPLFASRNKLKPVIAAAYVSPNSFADRGKFFL